jgi:hypothetical protein
LAITVGDALRLLLDGGVGHGLPEWFRAGHFVNALRS